MSGDRSEYLRNAGRARKDADKYANGKGKWRSHETDGVSPYTYSEGNSVNGHHLGRVTLASDIKMKPTYWAWASNGYGRIPVGELTIVAGHGEAGKSTFNIELIAQITRGELPGHWYGVPRFCLIAASEDDWEKTIVPRLMASGADLDMTGRFDVVTQETPDGIPVSLPQDYGELENSIKEFKAVWVFFDSVIGAIDIAKDANHGQHVRAVLMPLADIARRQQCVIIGNVHFNKNNAANAIERMSGSMEFRNVARAVIYLAMQEDGTGVISKQKNNLGRSWPSLAYDITEVLVDEELGITAGSIRIMGETDSDAAEIINRKPSRKMSEPLSEVVEVLKDMFRMHDTWKVEEALNELEKAGVSKNKTTIGKALDRLGIRSEAVYNVGKKGVDYYVWTTQKRAIKLRGQTLCFLRAGIPPKSIYNIGNKYYDIYVSYGLRGYPPK